MVLISDYKNVDNGINSIKVNTMRQMKAVILVGLLGLVTAAPASAEGFYFGAKTGMLVVDSSLVKDDAINTGVMVGYEFGVVLGDLGVEAEYTTTTSDGEVDTGQNFDVDTTAAYLAFRSAGPIYFKAKGGYLEVSGDVEDDSGASFGVGIGFGIGIAQLEAEITQTSLDPDNVYYASVGVQF